MNDVYLASLAGYYQLDEEQAISASIRYFSFGNIQFTDFAGNDLQSFRPREFSCDVGYSRKLSENLVSVLHCVISIQTWQAARLLMAFLINQVMLLRAIFPYFIMALTLMVQD